jgi:hypothetical protein
MTTTGALRTITLAACAAGLSFWFYTFWHIAQLPAGDGSGFRWLGEVPLTGITLACIVPALLLSISNRALPIAAGLAVAGLALYAMLWIQLLSEFAPG